MLHILILEIKNILFHTQKRRENMADTTTIKVELKDKNEKYILHPETEWSAIVDKPSICDDRDDTFIGTTRTDAIHINATNLKIDLPYDLNISTSETGGKSVSLADYPVNWNKLNNRPFQEILDLNRDSTAGSSSDKSSVENAVFGVYSEVVGSMGFNYYPAFALVKRAADGHFVRFKGFYLTKETDGRGPLAAIDDMTKFTGLLQI